MNISCVMIIKNGQKTVKKVLDSLSEFDDVVLYDTNSTDDTKKIALSYKNVNFIDGEFIGFGPTKNVAASYAKHKWIFSIDSDEVVSSELLKTLKNIKLDPDVVYGIYRTNFYKEYKIKYSGWGGQVIPRVYHIEKTKYNDKLLHENIITDNFKEKTLSGELEHYSYHSVSDFIAKVELYSSVYADEKAGKK
ncbi:MAG: glycosyltransferase family 2 protein, partial [Campylobacterota bacterium]|nr:glycosyltransferase family 2 protein [Campylobacterota bacterium]